VGVTLATTIVAKATPTILQKTLTVGSETKSSGLKLVAVI